MKQFKSKEKPDSSSDNLNCDLLLTEFNSFKDNVLKISALSDSITQKLKENMLQITDESIQILEILRGSYSANNRALSWFEMGRIGLSVYNSANYCKKIDETHYVPYVNNDISCKFAILFGVLLTNAQKDTALKNKLVDLNNPASELAKTWGSTIKSVGQGLGINLSHLLNFEKLTDKLKIRVCDHLNRSNDKEEIIGFIRVHAENCELFNSLIPKVKAAQVENSHIYPDIIYLRELENLTLAYFDNLENFSGADLVYAKINEVLGAPSAHDPRFFASSGNVTNRALFDLISEYKKDFDEIVEKYRPKSIKDMAF